VIFLLLLFSIIHCTEILNFNDINIKTVKIEKKKIMTNIIIINIFYNMIILIAQYKPIAFLINQFIFNNQYIIKQSNFYFIIHFSIIVSIFNIIYLNLNPIKKKFFLKQTKRKIFIFIFYFSYILFFIIKIGIFFIKQYYSEN
jgi:hypothetical protein